jgi:hypothetical protein
VGLPDRVNIALMSCVAAAVQFVALEEDYDAPADQAAEAQPQAKQSMQGLTAALSV